MDWNKMPSVTGGGKPYFYTTRTPQGMRWVVWDRIEEQWAVHGPQEAPQGDSPTLGYFKTAEAGKRFVENTQ